MRLMPEGSGRGVANVLQRPSLQVSGGSVGLAAVAVDLVEHRGRVRVAIAVRRRGQSERRDAVQRCSAYVRQPQARGGSRGDRRASVDSPLGEVEVGSEELLAED